MGATRWSRATGIGLDAKATAAAWMWLALAAPAAMAQNLTWIKQFGTLSADDASSVSVNGAAVYVAGSTTGALAGQTSAGVQDAYVRKYDASGNELWTRQFGTSSVDQALAMAADATGVYVAGYTRGAFPGQASAGALDAFLRRYDANGNELWTRQFGTPSVDQALAVAADATGVYVAGSTYGALAGQTSAGLQDAYLRKYDANGNELWTRQFGASSADQALGVAADSTSVYVAGYADGALPGQTSAGSLDAFVRKYDAGGNELWTRQFGSPGADLGRSVALDSTGVYLAGVASGALAGQASAGGTDAFIRKYDANGSDLWTRQFGSAAADDALAVAAASAGVLVAGFTMGALPGQTSAGLADAFVRCYDAAGGELWSLQFGTSTTEAPWSISAGPAGAFVAGFTFGVLPGQTGAGFQDAYLARLADPAPAPAAVIQVAIDIKPGSFPNAINLRSRGTVPVAILSSPTFAAATVDPATVTLARAPVKRRGNGAPMAAPEDVNGDGLPDLVVHIDTEELQISSIDTEAVLEGMTFDGRRISGKGSIQLATAVV